MKRPASNPIELTVEKVVNGGDGLARWTRPRPEAARADARHERAKAVFLPFTLPAERVRAIIEEDSGSFARGRVLELIERSPHRITPGCEYFFRCGGCQIQQAEADYQAELKREVLVETLARTGGIRLAEAPEVIAGEPWHYRNRTRLRFQAAFGGTAAFTCDGSRWSPAAGGSLAAADARPAERDSRRLLAASCSPHPRVGYFQRGSHQLLEVNHCPISSPLINRAIQSLTQLPAPPPSAREVELFAGHDDSELLVEFTFESPGTAEAEYVQFVAGLLPGCVSAAIGADERVRTVTGSGYLDYVVGDYCYRVSHASFFQVNRFLVGALARAAAADAGGKLAIDLFSGVGLFTLPLARGFEEVFSVESNPAAVRDLRQNVRAMSNVNVSGLDAAEFMRRLGASREIDLVLVDPPRGGLGRELVNLIIDAQPARIRSVSCDPATLGRDLKELTGAGYRIEKTQLFDLFPQTFHIETVTSLVRA